MKRLIILIFMCVLSTSIIFAQTTEQEEPPVQDETKQIESEKEFVYDVNQKGDQAININIMVNIPARPTKLNIGGSGQLGYRYFFTKGLSFGGSISFGYSITEGSNMFLFVPILGQVTYQFQVKKFEFPITIGLGGSFQNYLDRTYFGLTIKPEVAAFFRYSPEWSFGIFSGVYIMPQWYKNTEHNYTGIVCDVGASVRYHF